jgi:hypothetical protein
MSRWARTLTTQEPNPDLDLLPYVGQRVATFRFDLVDSITGYRTTVHPLSDQAPIISHDTARTITRQLSGLVFTVPESSLINVITSRIEPFMLIAGSEYPLGRFMYNNEARIRTTAGSISSGTLYDEMFIIDQRIPDSFSDQASIGTLTFFGGDTSPRVQQTLAKLLESLPVTFTVEPSPYYTKGAWPAGTSRGYIVEQLAIDGDYFSPWFDNTNVLRFIRSFDPSTAVVTFDLDESGRVMRERIIETDDLIEAPNTFVIISNDAAAQTSEIVGRYDVPSSAPHSVQNRGFVIPYVENRQIVSVEQAKAVATNLGQRQTIFERIELYTAPDPRHDSYDVLRWQGENWLELAWSLPCVEGAAMQHIARKAYTS